MTEIQSDTLTKIQLKHKVIYLIGTAHVSSESVDEVKQAIVDLSPDKVCLELDPGRYKTMTEGQSWDNVNIQTILKQGRGFFFLANLALSSFQKRMGMQTGVMPGEEMKAAAIAARDADIPIELCDRDIQITLRRAWSSSSLWNKMKMLGVLVSAAFSREELSSEDIEALKERSALSGMMEELAQELPTAKRALIDERDRYLATKIFNADGTVLVAAVGAGHAQGIVRIIEELDRGEGSQDLSSLESLPKKRSYTKLLPYLIPLAVAGTAYLRLYQFRLESGSENVLLLVHRQRDISWYRSCCITCSSADDIEHGSSCSVHLSQPYNRSRLCGRNR